MSSFPFCRSSNIPLDFWKSSCSFWLDSRIISKRDFSQFVDNSISISSWNSPYQESKKRIELSFATGANVFEWSRFGLCAKLLGTSLAFLSAWTQSWLSLFLRNIQHWVSYPFSFLQYTMYVFEIRATNLFLMASATFLKFLFSIDSFRGMKMIIKIFCPHGRFSLAFLFTRLPVFKRTIIWELFASVLSVSSYSEGFSICQ